MQCQTRLLKVTPYQSLATGKNYHGLIWADNLRYLIDCPEKICYRHIRNTSLAFAVASAVDAIEIAPECSLPEDVIELMKFEFVLFETAKEVKRNALFEGDVQNAHFFALSLTSKSFSVSPLYQWLSPPVKTGFLNSMAVSRSEYCFSDSALMSLNLTV